MNWYYKLGKDTPNFAFKKDNEVTWSIYGKDAVDTFDTESTCEMVRFIQSHISNPKQDDPNFFDKLTAASKIEGCQINLSETGTIKPQLAPVSKPSEIPISDGDTPSKQGLLEPPISGTVGLRKSSTSSEYNSVPPITEENKRPSTGNPHSKNGGEKPQTQTNAGDPVDIFNGAFYLEETDLEIPNTILPLSFTRTYRSGVASFGPFGWNWDHNFNLFIRELNSGDIALWRNLHEDIFKFDGTNFEPSRGVFEKLERKSGLDQIYEIKGKGGFIMHFERSSGWLDAERIPLLWVKDQHGNKLQLFYGLEDKLSEVRDNDDRYFHFEYDLCGLLVAVSDNAGRKFLYEHDEQTMQLTCVKSPAITDHPKGVVKIYHYEQPWALPELRHNIVRIEDNHGNIYVENTYDEDPSSLSFARVTEQLYGGFLYQFNYTQLQYVPANPVYINIPALRVEVMNPDFGLETYTFNYRGDLIDRRYRLIKDKSLRVVVWQYEFDEQGNPSKTTKPDGSDELSVFDFSNIDPRMRNNLLQHEITSASGFPAPSRIIWRGRYEEKFQSLIEEKNESGKTIKYIHDFDLTPASVTNSGKVMEVIQPNATLPDGSIQTAKTTFEYNSKGQITVTVFPDGTRNENIYGTIGNEKNRLIKQVLDVGRLNIEHKIIYDIFGFNSEIIDGNGNSTKQIFNTLGLLEKSILPAVNGHTSEYISHYDSDKKVISTEKPKGKLVDVSVIGNHILDKLERDVLGYPTKYILSSNTGEPHIINVKNDYRGIPTETINLDGSKIRTVIDERGLSISEEVIGKDGLKITSSKFYDRSGKLLQETNPFGVTTKYEYDGFSRLNKTTLSNKTEIINKWTINDLLESEESIGDDGTGLVRQLSFKSFTYDEKNRKIFETVKVFIDNPSASKNVTTTFYYDNLDRVVKIISNRNGISSVQYDGLGRVVMEADSMGNQGHYIYDKNGNVIQINNHNIEPDGSTTVIIKKFQYDERNRKVEMIEPDGAKISVEYDDRNMLVKQTDYLGIINEFFYNSYNTKVKEIGDSGGLNIVHQWEVDNMQRVTTYIDPTGQTSTYAFDSVGRNSKIEYPNGFSNSKTFNNFNQISQEKLGSGVEFTYNYDTSNRISQILNTSNPFPIIKVENHQFTYDGLSRVLEAKVGINGVSRKYDSTGRLLSETTLGTTIKCNYSDDKGEVEKIWDDGRTEKLSHNLNGIINKIEETTHGVLGSKNTLIASFKTSGINSVGKIEYHDGLVIDNTYDERKRLTEIKIKSAIGTNENIKYRYNVAGLKQVEAFLGQNPKISYFEFDNKYRLLNTNDSFTVTIPNATTQTQHNAAILAVKTASETAIHHERFVYNEADARLKYTESGFPDKDYSYLPGHKIQNDGINAYTHFDDGTLKTDGIYSYDVDALGRILTIKSDTNVITEIAYDAFGRPSIVNEVGKPQKSFHYFGAFVEQINENGIPARHITVQPGTGVPIAYHTALGTHYTLFDVRFNLIGLADTNGNLIETYRYKSFGLPQIYNKNGIAISHSAFDIEPIFGGQKFLDITGFYLSTKRLMNPKNGMFLSIDPKGHIDSACLYVYVSQNPIEFIDPNGEFATILGVALIGAGLAAFANRDKTGGDFWVSVAAGAVSGGIAGTGYGMVSFVAGGVSGGLINGAYQDGLSGAIKQGFVGGVAGAIGGAMGGAFSTAISARIYSTIINKTSSLYSTQISQYVGVGAGGAISGFYSSLAGNALSTGVSGENPFTHPEIISDSISGIGYGLVGGVASKSLIQGKGFIKTRSISGALGAEAEFYVENQTLQKINTKIRVSNVNGKPLQAKIPDLYGKIIGDVKNTESIPSLNKQNSQLRSINNAAKNIGKRMSIFHRPGVSAGAKSQVVLDGNIDLIPIRQFTPQFGYQFHPNEKSFSSK